MDISTLIGPTLPAGQPELRAVTATTIFGAFTRRGTSGALGNDTDHALLLGVREWADCVLVGAGTVRAEGYGSSDTPTVIVSGSLDLDPSSDLFNGTVAVATPAHSLDDASLAPRREALRSAGARLIPTGSGSAHEVVDAVRSLGYTRISCEGGPSLYAALFSAGLVDVLHLTVDPSLSGEDGPAGLSLDSTDTHRFTLEAAEWERDSMLFCRYRYG
ncbi:dihydrofolate reductase family protein [Corynebacterium timonense]|uniref:Pyrimidine reductase, riboflavin biosynthesis n=1 Tax=Corynebacterium timonense TaxID=441500 RepID=A0A1H1NHG8_9CORY|nr:dihydrofolate reductase family protein [Corynebacterium timonense]SDR98414.1 Pyrimidine reductase, riboflavin biosynthesis [Corynebacterium timonense]